MCARPHDCKQTRADTQVGPYSYSAFVVGLAPFGSRLCDRPAWVFVVLHPLRWIVLYIHPSSPQFIFITDDAFEIIALP